MKKVLIIGCPGSGKSTFARSLAEYTKLPLYYLDMIWHKADGTNITQTEFDSRLQDILNLEQWILDGNYLRTMPLRMQYCDTIFLLDFPLEVCLSGAAARIGKKREDMPWIEQEFDAEFRQFICDFPKNQLPQIYALLNSCAAGKEIVIFKSRQDINRYLAEMV